MGKKEVLKTAVWTLSMSASFVTGLNVQKVYFERMQPQLHAFAPDTALAVKIKTWQGFSARLPPQDIIVHVLSNRDFEERGNKIFTQAGDAAFKSFDAWTMIGTSTRPCEIFIPEGYVLSGTPSDGSSGKFNNEREAGTVAHELLHCTAGAWHK